MHPRGDHTGVRGRPEALGGGAGTTVGGIHIHLVEGIYLSDAGHLRSFSLLTVNVFGYEFALGVAFVVISIVVLLVIASALAGERTSRVGTHLL